MNDPVFEKKMIVTAEYTRKTENTSLTHTIRGTKNVNIYVLTCELIHVQIQKRIRQRI